MRFFLKSFLARESAYSARVKKQVNVCAEEKRTKTHNTERKIIAIHSYVVNQKSSCTTCMISSINFYVVSQEKTKKKLLLSLLFLPIKLRVSGACISVRICFVRHDVFGLIEDTYSVVIKNVSSLNLYNLWSTEYNSTNTSALLLITIIKWIQSDKIQLKLTNTDKIQWLL